MGGEFSNFSSVMSKFVSCSSLINFGFDSNWICDSGANQHMVKSDKDMFNCVDVSEYDLTVSHPNGTKAKVSKIGCINLAKGVVLHDVFYVPDYSVNLLSVHKLSKDSKINVVFNEYSCLLQDSKSGRILVTGKQDNGLYFVNKNGNNSVNLCFNSVNNCNLWHSRLGHPADQVLSILKDEIGVVDVFKHTCEVCHRAKQTRMPFPLSEHKTKNVGDVIHLDVWGPYKVTSKDGYKYFLTVVDDYSRAVWCYLLKSKMEVFENIENFYQLVLTQFKKKVKIFRSDNGTEFVNNKMDVFCKTKGILHQTSCAYTPQQNGVAERKHRHLLNLARSLLFQSGVPLSFWADCVLTAVYIINRLPSSVLLGKSPYELMFGFKPSYAHLRVFGCLCFSTVLNDLDKFAFNSEKCILIGYSNVKKGYKLWSLDNKREFYSRDVKFYETVFPYKSQQLTNQDKYVSESVNQLNFFDSVETSTINSINPNDEEGNNDSHEVAGSDQQSFPSTSATPTDAEQPCSTSGVESSSSSEGFDRAENTGTLNDENNLSEGNRSNVRRSIRNPTLPKRFEDFVLNSKTKYSLDKVVKYSSLSAENLCFTTVLNKTSEPTCYEEAAKDPRWVEAMNKEMEALFRNNTWTLTDLPQNRKAIGCKWVYRIKYKSNGEIERFKARLVAKGFNQREGLDFGETFSPVVKMVTIRTVVTLAVHYKWPLYQLDVDNAFLHGSITEDVYMKLPQGYYSKNETKVCKLIKSLYGLKQAPRKWNERLTDVLLKSGFIQSKCDHSLFIFNKKGVTVFLLVYVDDVVLTGNSVVEIERIKKILNDTFKIKDLGVLKYFLGIEVLYDNDEVFFSQRKYCLELLNEFGYLGCKPVNTPIEQSYLVTSKVDKNHEQLANVTGFQKLIGKLIYLSLTRPDISYTVQFLSQFMHSPKEVHLSLALRLLRYLKLSPGKGISFRKTDELNLFGYADSDWAKCLNTRKSVTGYCVFLGTSLVSWKSKKQNIVSRSTAEAEYRAMCSITCELMWIKNLLSELGVNCSIPMPLFCDSQAALSIAANPVFHERTKHFELDLHFLREKVADGIIKTEKVDSENQLADVFTKGLSVYQHETACKRLGLVDLFHPTE
ncbi:putative RNA-directed DNA polymerase [Helianthus annuus]|nr:putative RNA-directed DNA polymerase [Helianthus annuus]